MRNGEREKVLHEYRADILLVAQLKAQDVTPESLGKKDPNAAAELSLLIGLLIEAGVMSEVETLAEKIKKAKIPAPPAEQTDFLELTSPPAGREPKKIRPPWQGDSESFVAIAAEESTRRRALGSDGQHEWTVRRARLREELGLPAHRLSWKERFRPLTADEVVILKDMGFSVAKIRPGTWGYERMLLALKNQGK